MDRAKPGHEDEARQVNSTEDDGRTFAHGGTKNMAPERIADPTPWSLLVEEPRPIAQKPMLQTEKAGA
jgi:hypothetical protein